MRVSAVLTLATLALAVAGHAAAQEPFKLAAGPMAPTVQALCSGCHSADYIAMNSPFLDRAGWEAEVRKMIRVMGAPVPEDQVGPIVDYLTEHYGAK